PPRYPIILLCSSATKERYTRLSKPTDLNASNRNGGSDKDSTGTTTVLKMKRDAAIGYFDWDTMTKKYSNGFCMGFSLRKSPMKASPLRSWELGIGRSTLKQGVNVECPMSSNDRYL